MTGEPEELPKFAVTPQNYEHNPNPFLMAKTMCTKGEGKAIVAAIGMNSFAGKIEEKLHIEDEATPLQEKLEVIANEIGKIGVWVALFTFLVMSIRMVIVNS
jgi:Ca2+ transporting ATPase